ncbi:P-loop containing nucleoside triphosphate hydrolase protein [Mycena vitilis]|nr:P-loop containing nucleoside triphosphate hydrolase protein [Mycena vitilis]
MQRLAHWIYPRRKPCPSTSPIHEKGTTHRDLKPENVLLTKDNPPKDNPPKDNPPIFNVADFGLAKVVSSITMPRTMCGTPSYLAPEVVTQQNSSGYDSLQGEDDAESYSLVSWIIGALIWRSHIWVLTNVLLILIVHILLGLTLTSWSFFLAAPFGKSPQLAAVPSTFLAILFAIVALILKQIPTGGAFIFTIIFPPGFYIFANRAISGYENHSFATNALKGDPDNNLQLLAIIIAGIIDVFLWPHLRILLERRLYDPREPSTSRSWKCWGRRKRETLAIPPDVAVSIQGLGKTFNTSMFNCKGGNVTAVSDLTLDVPRLGISVLLGSNGAGKSTTLSIVGGLTGRSRGSVVFEGGAPKPPRGTLGIVPQKNVLIPELSCLQLLRVWRAVKWSRHSVVDEDLEQLLRDCDLRTKIHANASTLSGGQKRKLQLAIGLVGGSKIVLVDERASPMCRCTRKSNTGTLLDLESAAHFT